jgi:uncharacterized protein
MLKECREDPDATRSGRPSWPDNPIRVDLVDPAARGSRLSCWIMVSDRPGDAAQVTAVARAAGLTFEMKRIIPVGGSRAHKPPRRFEPCDLEVASSCELEPPWPDVMLTAGGWATRAALWVRDQAGGQPKVILIGRPKPGDIDLFSLVVTSSQYWLPDRANVMQIDFPVFKPDREQLTQARARWHASFSRLPNPLTGVLVGGRTKPFRFDREVALQLAEDLWDYVAREGGTLFVATSPRTAPEVADALRQFLPRTQFFDWHRDDRAHNPYLALLVSADRLIVTGDSVSMLTEAASLGRPLAIYPLPKGPSHRGLWTRFLVLRRSRDKVATAMRRLGCRAGLLSFPRDIEAFHRKLIERGHAVAFGSPFQPMSVAVAGDLPRVAARVRALVASGPARLDVPPQDFEDAR